MYDFTDIVGMSCICSKSWDLRKIPRIVDSGREWNRQPSASDSSGSAVRFSLVCLNTELLNPLGGLKPFFLSLSMKHCGNPLILLNPHFNLRRRSRTENLNFVFWISPRNKSSQWPNTVLMRKYVSDFRERLGTRGRQTFPFTCFWRAFYISGFLKNFFWKLVWSLCALWIETRP